MPEGTVRTKLKAKYFPTSAVKCSAGEHERCIPSGSKWETPWMYLQCSVYIHWNIWLNELFYKINLHWGSLQPTQALNLLKVAKPPAKRCHSEEQRWEQMNHRQHWVFENALEICMKHAGSPSVCIHLRILQGWGASYTFTFFFF